MPDISVIIPSHNVRQYVGECLDSILTQTAPVREIIVIDDSTDDSADLIRDYERSSSGVVKLFVVEPCNVSEARNIGLTHAAGKLVAYLDADDLWLPDKIAKQVETLDRHPDACGCHTRLFFFRDDLDDEGRREWDRIHDDPSFADIILKQNVTSSTVLVRREALEGISFDERTGHAEDTIWAADLRFKGPWRMAEGALTARRLHDTQVTKSAWHAILNTETRVRWCRDNAQGIGNDLAAKLEHTLFTNVIEFLEKLYWRREFKDFEAMRTKVREICPQYLEKSFLHTQRIYPQWLYRLRDTLLPAK